MQAIRHVLALLALSLLLTACGQDTGTTPEIPSWAKVAPEQVAEAKKHGVPVAFENDLGMRFVLIPAGTFLMGSPLSRRDLILDRKRNENAHLVTITKPFYMQATEVTNAQYRVWKPNHDSGTTPRPGEYALNADDQPVVEVAWTDANDFAIWLSVQGPLRSFALPTEAKWEYACRAGTDYAFHTGGSLTRDQANFGTPALGTTRAVGSYPPNAWGLYDMHGNVEEWCLDWYSRHLGWAAVTDPKGPSQRVMRAWTRTSQWWHVLRGGSWHSERNWVRSACRRTNGRAGPWVGFRLVSPLPEPGERQPTQPSRAEDADEADPQKPTWKAPTLEEIRVKRGELESLANEAWDALVEIQRGNENFERRSTPGVAHERLETALFYVRHSERHLRCGEERFAAYCWVAMEDAELEGRQLMEYVREYCSGERGR